MNNYFCYYICLKILQKIVKKQKKDIILLLDSKKNVKIVMNNKMGDNMRLNKKTIISLVLCVGVLFMAVGYSVLMTELKINGTANITSTWDIRVTGITEGVAVGSAYNIESPSFTATTAKFNVSLVNPGDQMTYEVTIENKGTVTAILDMLDITTSGTDAIIYEVTGLKSGDTLAAGQVKKMTVVARYNSNVIADPTDRVKRLKVGLNWVQYTNQIISSGTYTIAYDSNGGNGTFMENTTCMVGYNCTLRNLTYSKKGYSFLGWSTSKDGSHVYRDAEVVTNLTSKGKTVTLYAVWGVATDFAYTGNVQQFVAPVSGSYKLEAWGAQGGTGGGSADGTVTGGLGGYGGYSTGTIALNAGDILYVYVGGKGGSENFATINDGIGGAGGYNGGGTGGATGRTDNLNGTYDYSDGGGGGGATDFRTKSGTWNDSTSLSSRIMVAGGGGGGARIGKNYKGGNGGGASGTNGTGRTYSISAGTQTTGYAKGIGESVTIKGSQDYSWGESGRGGGGGGYYGGKASQYGNNGIAGGGGGSGYVGSSLLDNKYMYCYSCTTSSAEDTRTYSTYSVSSNAVSNYAKSGDGYARVTLIDKEAFVAQIDYTGSGQTFTAPKSGFYKVELWGAAGSNTSGFGNGAYTSGIIELEKGEKLYVYVGARANTFNGGGYCDETTKHGGGATDIRLINGAWNNATGLNSRIMVAAGGGSVTGAQNGASAGHGGTLYGLNGTNHSAVPAGYIGYGATPISGGTVGSNAGTATAGSFGIGGNCGVGSGDPTHRGGGGGGGYYGGGGSAWHTGSGGGSSYISGYTGVSSVASSTSSSQTLQTRHYSGKYFINGSMTAGANSGNGKAKITYLESSPNKKDTKLNNVQYIKDCINGSSANTSNHWVELQAIYNGINVARSASITSTVTSASGHPLSLVIDGDISYGGYADITGGTQCVVVNLGTQYDLDEIAVWHYWGDGRSYNNHSLYVSKDNSNWTTIVDNVSGRSETSDGLRITAY